MRRIFGLCATAAIAVAICVPAWAGEPGGAAFLYPGDSEPFGMSYAEWQGAYQIWLTEIPSPENPILDPASPRNCEEQPSGDIAFLGPVGSDCVVSDDVALALSPALGFWECSTAEGLGETFAELRHCARGNFAVDMDPTTYHQTVRIDGQRLLRQRRWVSTTPGEIIDFPEDNIWGGEPGPSRSVTKGFLFILRPLDEGAHRIVVDIVDDVLGEFRWVYKLEVVEDHPV